MSRLTLKFEKERQGLANTILVVFALEEERASEKE